MCHLSTFRDGDVYLLLHIFDQILPKFCNFEYKFGTFVINWSIYDEGDL
jgi:hypothetical protein